MLYRYPIEKKKDPYEITDGSRRYDSYTGEELPPIPYINLGGTQQGGYTPADTARTSSGRAAAKTSQPTVTQNVPSQTVSAADAEQQRYERQLALLEKQYANAKKTLLSNYNMSKKSAEQNNNSSLRDLYVAYMQGIRNMPQLTALWGAGGEIESLKMQHRTNYEDNRAKQNLEYSDILSELQRQYDNDVLQLEEKYLKQLMSL